MSKLTNEEKCEILLERLIEQAKTELECLKKKKHINCDALLISIGKLIEYGVRNDVEKGN